MAYNTGKSQAYPSAPTEPPTAADDFQRGPPPPSYEECLNMPSAGVVPQQLYHNYNAPPYQQQQQPQMLQGPPSYQMPQYSVNYSMPGPSTAYGYSNPYQTHMHQQQIYYSTSVPVGSPHALQNSSPNVLVFDKNAKIRPTAKGTISVPPPPPGYAPTPAQLSAMSGQPVIVKKQKKSFF